MPPNRRMDEENVVHLYKMVLLSGKKKLWRFLKMKLIYPLKKSRKRIIRNKKLNYSVY